MSLHPRRATRAEEKDLALLAETGLLGATMPQYFSWRMQEEWRDKEDEKPIKLETTLNAALNKTSWQIVDAICNSFGFSAKGKRQAKASRITEHLKNPSNLRAVLNALPPELRLALKRVLDAGGWIRLNALTREFGDQEGDAWFWNENPPRSILGRLRVHGLLFVGKARLAKRAVHTAVIPTDLREPLAALLAEQAAQLDAIGDYNLVRARQGIVEQYTKRPEQTVLPRPSVEEYIATVAAEGKDAFAEWRNLEHFDYFLSRSLLDDLDAVDANYLGTWVTTFLEASYIGDFALDDKREMLKSVARLYRFLASKGQVKQETVERVEAAVKELVSQKGEIAPQALPSPLGGEVILEGRLPNGQVEQFTYNDRWLLIVAALEFQGDLNALYERAAQVQDGAKKQQHIERLGSFEPTLWERLIQNVSQPEAEFAVEWFYEDDVNEASGW